MKKQLEKITKKLIQLIEFIETTDSAHMKNQKFFLEEYLCSDQEIFTYEWYDEFFQDTISNEYDIFDILSSLSREVAFPISNILHGKADVVEFVNYYYYYVLKNAIYSLMKKEENKPYNLGEMAISFFVALGLFEQDEQLLCLKSLTKALKNDKETFKWDANGTLFPLVYGLANQYLSDINDKELQENIKWGLEAFSFSNLYQKVFDNYLDKQLNISSIIYEMCDYHLKKCIDNSLDEFPEFEYPIEQAVPWEILVLLRLRALKGLSNEMIGHPLIDPFMTLISNSQYFELSEKNQSLRQKIFKNFEYNTIEK